MRRLLNFRDRIRYKLTVHELYEETYKVTNEKVREATALPKLEDIIRRRRLRWLGHLSRMEYHSIPRQAHHWEPDSFRRKPGILDAHVKTGGSNQQGSDLKKIGIGWDDVQEATEDRRSWWIRVVQCVFDAG